MILRVGMARALLLTVVMAAAACSGSQPERTARTALDEVISENPGAPVVVPVRWSDDWEWFEPDGWQTDSGRVIEVHYRITPVDRTGQATIGICVAPPDAARAAAGAGADDDDGWRPCDGREDGLSRTVDGLETVIYTYGDEPPPDVWSNIELTTSWRSVDWLDHVPGGCCW